MRRTARPGGRRGAVIAFVGSEATGKSTMLAETERHLADGADGADGPDAADGPDGTDVRRVHAGKPPSTPLTAVPNLFLPALRALAPGQRSTRIDARHVEHGDDDGLRRPPLLFAIRAVLLAHDRRALLRGAHAAADAGAVVLCDRYPSSATGAPDSPQLARWSGVTGGNPLLAWLVRAETRMYAEIPPPDVVFHLWAPLEVTLQRNRDREKTEPEELVTLRHRQTGTIRFDGCPVHRLDTTRPLSRSVQDVRDVVATTLAQPAPRPDGQARASSR